MKLYYKSSMYVEAKSDRVAYQLWFLVGSHHAYLGKWFNQVVLWILLLAWVPVVLFPEVAFLKEYLGIFAIGLPALGVMWLVIDLILIPYHVKKYNEIRFSAQPGARKREPVIIEEETERFGYPITY